MFRQQCRFGLVALRASDVTIEPDLDWLKSKPDPDTGKVVPFERKYPDLNVAEKQADVSEHPGA
jgi:hypothetical protein